MSTRAERERELARLRQHDVGRLPDDWLERLEDAAIPVRTWKYRDAPSIYDVPVVYFIQAEMGGPIKIGWSKLWAVVGRLMDLQVGNPDTLVIRRTVYGDLTTERLLHATFGEARTRAAGEWFYPVPALVAVARALADDRRGCYIRGAGEK